MKNGYELSRAWFDFAFDTPDCKMQHTCLYMWIIELNNRFGWKEQFGLPTLDTMEGLSITNRQTYLNALHDLVKWGFIKIVQPSKNRFSATIISVTGKGSKKGSEALDRALKISIPVTNDDTVADNNTPAPPATAKQQQAVQQVIPSYEEVKAYFKASYYSSAAARQFYDYYTASEWKDKTGKPILFWKQAALAKWFIPDNKETNLLMPTMMTVAKPGGGFERVVLDAWGDLIEKKDIPPEDMIRPVLKQYTGPDFQEIRKYFDENLGSDEKASEFNSHCLQIQMADRSGKPIEDWKQYAREWWEEKGREGDD